MIGTIRKHSTVLWVIIIAAVIVSFVIFFTPGAGRNGPAGGRTGSFGTMNGRPITKKEYLEAQTDTILSVLIRTGSFDRSELQRRGFSLETQTRNRLVLLDRIRALNVQVGPSEIAGWIQENLGDARQPGSAQANYDNLIRNVLPRQGVTEAEFQSFIGREIAIGHLLAVAGVPGRLITPREASQLYRAENEKLESAVVLFSWSNHVAGVQVNPVLLAQFYTNTAANYREPERVQVHFVRFAATNFLAQADALMAKDTNLAQEIERAYQRSNPASMVDTNGQVLPPDAAKAKLRERYRDGQALLVARRNAANFATNLESLNPVKAENLINLAAAKGILPGLTEPFSQRNWPTNFAATSRLVEAAFRLTDQAPISAPLVGTDGVYLFALKQRFPSLVPPLEAVQERVLADFKRDAALRLARDAGTNFVRSLTNALVGGKTFEAAATAAGLQAVNLPMFTRSTQSLPDLDPRLNIEQLKFVLASRSAGQATDLVLTPDGAFVGFLKSRTPVPDNELKLELPKFVAGLQRNEQSEAFEEWFRRQLEMSQINTIKGRDESPATPE